MFKKLINGIIRPKKDNPKESLTLHTTAETTDSLNSSNKLVQHKQVKGTPFILLKFEKTGWIIACGNTRTDEEYQSQDEAILYIKSKPWNLICMVMESMMKHLKDSAAKTGFDPNK